MQTQQLRALGRNACLHGHIGMQPLQMHLCQRATHCQLLHHAGPLVAHAGLNAQALHGQSGLQLLHHCALGLRQGLSRTQQFLACLGQSGPAATRAAHGLLHPGHARLLRVSMACQAAL